MPGIVLIMIAGVFMTSSASPLQGDQPATSREPSGTDPAPAEPGKGLSLDCLLDGQVELADVRQKIVNSNNNLGLSRQDLEQSLRISDTHDAALLRATLEIPIEFPTRIRIFGAGGIERTGFHLTSGTENPVFGDPAGTTETDFDSGLAPVWNAGAEFRLGLGDAPFDLAASFDARGGSNSDEDGVTKESTSYQRYRVGLFAGWSVTPGIRPYLGAHYSRYRGKLKLTDIASGSEVELHTADETPVDVAAGVELSSWPILGAIEVDFVGRVTILVSAGIRF